MRGGRHVSEGSRGGVSGQHGKRAAKQHVKGGCCVIVLCFGAGFQRTSSILAALWYAQHTLTSDIAGGRVDASGFGVCVIRDREWPDVQLQANRALCGQRTNHKPIYPHSPPPPALTLSYRAGSVEGQPAPTKLPGLLLHPNSICYITAYLPATLSSCKLYTSANCGDL